MTKKLQLACSLILILCTTRAYCQDSINLEVIDYKINKGRFYSSLNFSLDQRNAENENQLIRQVIDQNKYDYTITANAGFAIKDNLTLGFSAGYGRAKEVITFLDQDDMEVQSNLLEQSFSFLPNLRQYIPIGEGRLQIIVQTQLGFTFGESLQRDFMMNDVNKIETDFIDFQLGINPGLVLFFNRNWALETTVGVAGFSARLDEKTVNNDVDAQEKVQTTNIDLKLNLLELSLGVAYYF
ncbi:autotransporter outer membrane beta-barrel domain-containing protein [Jejuia pallidilutea]|uniref:autotransporter outer membrane beta-barrel domain-containing protein n=1 Tax=Jejuia pallidilutea TaxID=504487 RepID=UPI0005A9BF68|nr:autotransporter outer membrane beta-barrel domain-containing protein [Jejuia pallidilutea]